MIRTAVIVAVILAAVGTAGPSFATNKKLSEYNPPAAATPAPAVCYGADKAGKKIEVACPANP